MPKGNSITEATIKEAAKQYDLAVVFRLSMKGMGLRRIENLNLVPSLTELDLSSNNIARMEGLEPLESLKRLVLANNQIGRLEGVGSLDALETLQLNVDAIVEQGLCIGCGLCEALAPQSITVRKTTTGFEVPVVIGELHDTTVDLIYDVCPGTRIEGLPDRLIADDTVVDAVWGPVRRIVRAWAGDPNVRHIGSTGGVLAMVGSDAWVLSAGGDSAPPTTAPSPTTAPTAPSAATSGSVGTPLAAAAVTPSVGKPRQLRARRLRSVATDVDEVACRSRAVGGSALTAASSSRAASTAWARDSRSA